MVLHGVIQGLTELEEIENNDVFNAILRGETGCMNRIVALKAEQMNLNEVVE